MQRPAAETPRIEELGADGQRSTRRLFMQLLVYTGGADALTLGAALGDAGLEGVTYDDLHDPQAAGVLTVHEDPDDLVDRLRPVLRQRPFSGLTLKPGFAMLGRSYALGYEKDLDETLRGRPRRHALEPTWPWAVWYPLRRSGAFERLPAERQREILMEHGRIGMSWGASGYAHDIRLACHGIDPADNDFLIGLMGPELAPLSLLVQRMRQTEQTSHYLERLGPFFVGRVAWRSGPAG